MTNNLKCPFCGVELTYRRSCGTLQYAECENEKCIHCYEIMPTTAWQALIDGKKAQNALKRAKEIYVRDVAYWEGKCDCYDGEGEIERFFDKEIAE